MQLTALCSFAWFHVHIFVVKMFNVHAEASKHKQYLAYCTYQRYPVSEHISKIQAGDRIPEVGIGYAQRARGKNPQLGGFKVRGIQT